MTSTKNYKTMHELRGKRFFDLFVVILSSVTWVPVLVICSLAILVFSGRPIFYISERRTGEKCARVIKFRTMVRNAASLCNRDNQPVENNVHFLNIPSSSPLYTFVGRIIEKATFTEIPQLLQVLKGEMSLVGSRPLPENVVSLLNERYSITEQRFATPAGLTGPAQLVGRDSMSDYERLKVEGEYCRMANENYTWRLDFVILLYTTLISAGLMSPLSVEEILKTMDNLVKKEHWAFSLFP